jgi:hypothetical protein
MNGDGIPDLLLPADGSVGIALGNGDGTYQTPFAVGVGPGVGQVFAQRLTADPKRVGMDLVAPDGTGGVLVLVNVMK